MPGKVRCDSERLQKVSAITYGDICIYVCIRKIPGCAFYPKGNMHRIELNTQLGSFLYLAHTEKRIVLLMLNYVISNESFSSNLQ